MKTFVPVDQNTYKNLKSWFRHYVESFYSSDAEFQRNIVLKEQHTLRVCDEIKDIGGSLDLNDKKMALVEISALFHDIGRFEQFKRYRTFSDLRSEDHAHLGVKILESEAVLDSLDPVQRDLIFRVISYHNKARVPETEDVECVFFSKLLRDADKLDIWNIIIRYYDDKEVKHNGVITHELPDPPSVSDPVMVHVMTGEYVRFDDLKTLNDYKLMQMSWIYDINFPRTFQLIKKRHYLEKMRDSLNIPSGKNKIYGAVKAFLEERIKGDQTGWSEK